MSEKLLPCPWCGDTTAFVERADYSSCYVHCNGCGAHGPIGEDTTADNSEETPGYAQAAELWNRRELESASQPGGGEAVAKIVGVDEYGPQIQWSKHWVELNGRTLYVKDEQ